VQSLQRSENIVICRGTREKRPGAPSCAQPWNQGFELVAELNNESVLLQNTLGVFATGGSPTKSHNDVLPFGQFLQHVMLELAKGLLATGCGVGKNLGDGAPLLDFDHAIEVIKTS
jgi:hypothetical protein